MIIKLTDARTTRPQFVNSESIVGYQFGPCLIGYESEDQPIIRECTLLHAGGVTYYVEELPGEITIALAKVRRREEALQRAHFRSLRNDDPGDEWKGEAVE